MVLRRGAGLLLAFLVAVSCQRQQDLLRVPTEPSQPKLPSGIAPKSGPLDFIMMNTDDNTAVLFGYELLESIRIIQVECEIQKREEELDFNGELDGAMRSYQASERKISRLGGLSNEEKKKVDSLFRRRFGGMNEERTAELALLQRKCDKKLKHLLDSKKMEATGYAEALLKTDPAEFTQLLFDITDYRRQLEAGLNSCLQFYERGFGKFRQQRVGDPADLCYQDAVNVLLNFMHEFVMEISQLPEQFYGDDEDFVVAGSGEGMRGSGEPTPRVVDPVAVPVPPVENLPTRVVEPEIVRIRVPIEEPSTRPVRPFVNKPVPPVENLPTRFVEPNDDSKEIVRIHLPNEPKPTKPVKPSDSGRPVKFPFYIPATEEEEEPTTSQPATDPKEPPSRDVSPSSNRPTGPTKVRVATPSTEEEEPTTSQPATDSKEPSKTPPFKDKGPFSDRPTGPTNVHVFTPSDEEPSSPTTKLTLPPNFTFHTQATEREATTAPEENRVSTPTPPSKTEEPQEELLSEASDEDEGDASKESPSPVLKGKQEVHLLGLGVEVQVGVEDDGVEVDIDVTTETLEDGEESESAPDESETTRDDDSESEEEEGEEGELEGEEEEEGFSYQHIIIYAFMVVGSLLVIIIVILIISILAVRRKRNSLRDSPLLSEEQKVAVMKQSGYVNPTYKFFAQVNDS